jgi:hypothetical protein
LISRNLYSNYLISLNKIDKVQQIDYHQLVQL